MQIGVNKDNYSSNTIKLSDMQWAEWTDVALAAPTLAVDTSGVATITDSNPEGSVDHYVVNFYEGGSVKAAVTAVGGQKLDVSKVPNGTYSLKAIAVAKPGYTNSPESNAVDNFVVNNEGGVKYDLKTDVVASDCPAGTWSVWAAQAAWSQGCEVLVSEAKYDNGTITVTFTSTGGPTAYGLQIAYRDTNNTTGKTYSFDIQASSDMDIQVESGGAAVTQLKAGVLQHLSGVDADNNFYVQVNIKDNVGGTITISNVTWS